VTNEVVFQYDDSGDLAQICYYCSEDLSTPASLEVEFVRLLTPVVDRYPDVYIDLRAAEAIAVIHEVTREVATVICQEMWDILKAAGWIKSDDPDDGNLELDANIPVV